MSFLLRVLYLILFAFTFLQGCAEADTLWKNSNSSSPKILVFEVCPNPYMKEETEARDLYRYFKREDLLFSIITNDLRWEEQTLLSASLIESKIVELSPDIIHFAIHGNKDGLVINHIDDKDRFLPISSIEKMDIWEGKIIVSGACNLGVYANTFLDKGAKMVIASDEEIPWIHLGQFFESFYIQYFQSNDSNQALSNAISLFPEYESYKIYDKEEVN